MRVRDSAPTADQADRLVVRSRVERAVAELTRAAQVAEKNDPQVADALTFQATSLRTFLSTGVAR